MPGPAELELERRLQIQPGQSVAVVNAAPESRLNLLSTAGSNPDQADVVIGFAVRGSDLRRDWLTRASRQYGVEVVEDVSVTDTWSALRLRPVKDDYQPDTSTTNENSK